MTLLPHPRYTVVEVYGAHVELLDRYWTRRAAERRRRREHRRARQLRLPGIVSEALHYRVVTRA